MIELVFGVQRSWQRRVCMVLSLVVAVLGIVLMLVGDVAEGAMVAIVGIVSGVVLARMVEATASRAATSALLGDIARMGDPVDASPQPSPDAPIEHPGGVSPELPGAEASGESVAPD